MSNVIFVGNIPYNMTEEQLIAVFNSVGQVVGFRLVFDRDTGKAKGYGFCEFADHETALSAVRNLNNAEVGGRFLRIDLADGDPLLEGKTTVRGEIIDAGHSEPRWRNNQPRSVDDSFTNNLPPGKPLRNGMSSLDAISETLAGVPHAQMMDLLAQMKTFIVNQPNEARAILSKNPQLSYALFQALVMQNIVPPEVVLKMSSGMTEQRGPPGRQGGPPPPRGPMAQPPPHMPPPQQSPYPHHSMPPFPPPVPTPPGVPGMAPPHAYPPPPPAYYRPPIPTAPMGHPMAPQAPPPASATSAPGAAAVPPAVAAAAGIDDTHREMIMQILTMSQDSINALPESQRASIIALRNQFMPQAAV